MTENDRCKYSSEKYVSSGRPVVSLEDVMMTVSSVHKNDPFTRQKKFFS